MISQGCHALVVSMILGWALYIEIDCVILANQDLKSVLVILGILC